MPNTQTVFFTALALSLIFIAACSSTKHRAPVCMAGATLSESGRCLENRAPEYPLPFKSGYETKVVQGFHGPMTHDKELAHAVDLNCEAGTPVVAAHKGRVISRRQDSTRGCAKASCLDDANYVKLDHGNGIYTEYYHLQPESVVVEKGEEVCRGEVIGLCGSTGYATAPHLHFAATDLAGRTIPFRFRESNDSLAGFPIPGTTLTSSNKPRSRCDAPSYSTLSTSAFSHRGVKLDASLQVVYQTPPSIEISGEYLGDRDLVAINLRRKRDSKIFSTCSAPGDSGEFALKIESLPPGEYIFSIAGTDKDCRISGWGYRLFVRP